MTLPFLKNHVSVAERAFVARQMATMLNSGLAIDRAVAILANQVGNPYLTEVFKQIETDLEAGLAFSTAIAKHPKVFNRVFVNVIVAGEAVGKMSEVLDDLADRLEKDQDLISKIRAALYYPIFVFITLLIVGAVLMVKVVPQFEGVFQEAKVELPFTTKLLIGTSNFLANQWFGALIIFIIILWSVGWFFRSDRGKLFLDFLSLHMPTGLAKDIYMGRFARTLSLLTRSGTPIIEALSITAEVINNRYYANVLLEARDEIARGIPLSIPLSKQPIIPPIVAQMVVVGEQTGRLDEVLMNLADYYEEESSNKLKALSSLFEPLILMIVGVGVAFLIFAIFIPLYSITKIL